MTFTAPASTFDKYAATFDLTARATQGQALMALPPAKARTTS